MHRITIALALVVVTLGMPGDASAFWGSLFRKTVATGAKKTAAPIARRGLVSVGRGAVTVGGKAGKAAVASSAAKGASVAARQVFKSLGIPGVKAMAKLSPKAAKQFAEMAGILAKSPHRTSWLTTIAKRGDDAVTWLWKRKGAIAVGAGATAVVLAPEDFIAATERIATKALEVGGEHVVRPFAVATAQAVTAPIGNHLANHGLGLAGLVVRIGLLAGAACYLYYRFRLRPSAKRNA